jgi:hypothetical protein
MAPGETLELIFSNKTGKDFSWDKAKFETKFPEKWVAVDSNSFGETLVLKLTVPPTEKETAQNIKINFLNFKDDKKNESLNLVIFIKKKLVNVAISNLQLETKVNEPIEYSLTLSNDSIASHSVRISSTLPKFWLDDTIINLNGKNSKDSIKEIKLKITPRSYGNKDFSITVESALNGNSIDFFNARLTVDSTLKGKYAASLFGFPVLTPTLWPFYLMNSLLSLLK